MLPRLSARTRAARSSMETMNNPHSMAGPEHRPSLVSWNLTAACNLRCSHCYLGAGARADGELDTGEALAVVDELAGLGTEMLILTGGEPLLRRDLYDIARRAADQGLIVVMGTNGLLLDDDVAVRLVASGVKGIGVSVDSVDADRHDAFRGLPGAWQGALRAVDACRAAGLQVVIQTTLKSDNLDELPQLVDLAKAKGAQAFNAYYLVCTGRGERLTDITPQQYEHTLGVLIESQSEHLGQIMLRAKCAPNVGRVACEKGIPMAGSAGCLAGRSYVRIGPTGEVTPCPYMPTSVGNVRDGGIGTLWVSAPLFRDLRRKELGGRCGRCEYGDVCGGCRARALALLGDHLAEDPWCVHEPSDGERRSAHPITWTPEATERLARIPSFIRDRIRAGLEAHARSRGLLVITPQLMAEVRRNMGGHPFGGRGHPAAGGS